MPPSALLSYYAGTSAKPKKPLTEMVIRMAKFMISEIETVSLSGRTIDICNPCHEKDILTDRWPDTVTLQSTCAEHLKELVVALEKMHTGHMASFAVSGDLTL
ncbi:hypothetical protein [uncultured Ruegeria sp.]|uniref:hypothetical protein n=1 Tax=uncultured Ruegeria sp. TaxID=259304 RepID=UPI00261AD696|nr:hypothetical protein [uncultured Ruegeria sp.]